MAKGNQAKQNLINAFIKANPESYIGEVDKKHYFWSEEDGEKVQVAISLTCPKVYIGEAPKTTVSFGGGHSFGESNTVVVPTPTAEISEEEKDNIAKLMKELGL